MTQHTPPPITVLFIDASTKQRTFWVNQLRLRASDYDIVQASDMQSGLDLYRSRLAPGQARRIDCVVLELSLPDHEGFKTLVELVPLASRPQIAVVVLTLMSQRVIWELARNNGAFTCLAKQHATGEDLHRAIQNAIEFVGQMPKEDRHLNV